MALFFFVPFINQSNLNVAPMLWVPIHNYKPCHVTLNCKCPFEIDCMIIWRMRWLAGLTSLPSKENIINVTHVTRYQRECEPVSLMLITIFRDTT